jgi:hypothetical protein
MTPSSTRKGATVHRYYRCIARNKVAVGACPSRPLAAKQVENLVRQQVVEVARRLDEKGRSEGSTVDAAVARHTGRRIQELKARRQELRFKLDERERELAGVDEEGGDTPNRLTKRHRQPDKLREELRSVQAQLGHLEQLVLSGAWIAEQLRALDQVWDRLLPINRLRVVRSVVERVEVDSTTGEVRVSLKDWVSEALTGREQGHAA